MNSGTSDSRTAWRRSKRLSRNWRQTFRKLRIRSKLTWPKYQISFKSMNSNNLTKSRACSYPKLLASNKLYMIGKLNQGRAMLLIRDPTTVAAGHSRRRAENRPLRIWKEHWGMKYYLRLKLSCRTQNQLYKVCTNSNQIKKVHRASWDASAIPWSAKKSGSGSRQLEN